MKQRITWDRTKKICPDFYAEMQSGGYLNVTKRILKNWCAAGARPRCLNPRRRNKDWWHCKYRMEWEQEEEDTFCGECEHLRTSRRYGLESMFCRKYKQALDYYDGILCCAQCRDPLEKFVRGEYKKSPRGGT